MIRFRSVLLLSLIVGFFLMSGCTQITQTSTQSVTVPSKANKAAWEQRKSTLARKNSWNLKSKIALSYQEEHWQFGLDWAQKAFGQYAMQIKNPLTGAIVAKLFQNRQGASLLDNDGKTYHSKNAEQLLQSQSGLKLPLNGMQYWVKGITSPQYKVDKLALDARGRPQIIQQAGWLIQYPAYLGNEANALPRKIILRRAKDNVSVKLITKKWQGL